MPVISLYWFAEQQQNSSLRRQKHSLFCSNFNVESNEYPEVPSFFKEQKVALKLQKNKKYSGNVV